MLQKFGAIRPFVNILESEQRHIRALRALFEKYAIALPTDDWETRVTVPDSVQQACEQGVEAEIENGAMYQPLLKLTQGYPDVQAVFLNLQRASQENHLRAFQRCAERSKGNAPVLVPQHTDQSSPGCCDRRGRRGQGHRHRWGQSGKGRGLGQL